MKKLLKFLGSIKLAVALLSFLMILVLLTTFEQVDTGIFFAKKKYFDGFFVWQQIGGLKIPILPGGLTIGFLLLINLITTHFSNFKFKPSKIGIWLIHIGLIMLIVGSGITHFFGTESQLVVKEGETKSYTENFQT